MSDRLRLVLLSFVMLFLELALIRWAGSNVLYLSYFSNFVLLGSFLGIGIGFLRARKEHYLFPYAPVALAALVAFVRFFPVKIRSTGSDIIFFGGLQRSGPPRYLVLTVIFIVVTAAMALIGEGVARAFAKFGPLEAYRLDLIGSIAGSWKCQKRAQAPAPSTRAASSTSSGSDRSPASARSMKSGVPCQALTATRLSMAERALPRNGYSCASRPAWMST